MPQVQLDDEFFLNNYNTTLTPEQEMGYNNWIQDLSKKRGRDVSKDNYEYDMRGFYASGLSASSNGHMDDRFKKPNHPTFSDKSNYSGALGPNGEKFIGGHWGKDFYVPSPEMLKYTHKAERLQEYMNRVEPGYHLILPK